MLIAQYRPLASSMLTPGVADIQKEFHSSSTIIAAFLVSVYLLGYVLGPFIIAPLSELYGRVPVYHGCNALLLIFTIACAVAQTLPQLMVFRFFAGVGGVCPLTIGAGTVADMIYKEKRAGVMAIWAMGPYLGPVVGPIAGGFLVEATDWRWVFWVLAITVCFNLPSHARTYFGTDWEIRLRLFFSQRSFVIKNHTRRFSSSARQLGCARKLGIPIFALDSRPAIDLLARFSSLRCHAQSSSFSHRPSCSSWLSSPPSPTATSISCSPL